MGSVTVLTQFAAKTQQHEGFRKGPRDASSKEVV